MEKNELTIKEYKNLITMLNSSPEDFELAVTSIINLNLDIIYILFFIKFTYFDIRRKFIKRLSDENISYANIEYKSFNDLFNTINNRKSSDQIKNILEYEYTKYKLDKKPNPDEKIIKLKWND